MQIFAVENLKTRLDKFLVEQLPGTSRSQLQKVIAAGGVTVNGTLQIEAKYVVRKGDEVGYDASVSAEAAVAPRSARPEIKTLYDADGLLVIDKPAGLSVHPGAGVKGDSLSDLLLYEFPEISGVGEAHRPGIVHRLDKDTSGVMLIAKSPEMYDYLKDAFAERKVKKEYIALTRGVPDKAHAYIETAIGKSRSDFRKYATKDVLEAKQAVTEYRVLEVLAREGQNVDKMALISVNLHTGRTHQIRVHLHSLGHPLMGDTLYGGKTVQLEGLARQFLHARRIEVRLPDGAWIEAESPLSPDLRTALSGLRSKVVDTL